MRALFGLGQLLPALVATLLAFDVWPRLLCRVRGTGLSATLSYLVLALAIWIAVVLALGALRIVELSTLVALAIVLPLALRWLGRRATLAAAPVDAAPKTLDAAIPAAVDGPSIVFELLEAPASRAAREVLGRLRHGAAARAEALRRRLTRPADIALLAALAALFVGSLWPYLVQAAPATALGYQWLLAGKSLALDEGLWLGGVAPPGLPALFAAINSIFAIDMLNVVDLAAPLAVLFLAAAAAFLAESLSGSRWAAFLAVVVVGLTRLPALGLAPAALGTPIGPHVAAAAGLVLLALVARALRTGERLEVAPLWAAAFVAGAVDPLTAAAVLAVAAGIVVTVRPSRHDVQSVAVAMGAAALPTVVPLLGLLTGHAPAVDLWHASSLPAGFGPRLADLALPAALAVAVLGHALLYPSVRRRPRGRLEVALGLMVLLLAALLAVLPAALAADALGSGLPALLALPLASAWLYSHSLRLSASAEVGAAALITFVLLVALPAAPAPLARFEPTGSALAYLEIAEAYPKYTWTIVSPTTQYPEVLGSGWHTELVDFVRDDSLRQAKSRRFLPRRNRRLPITTPEVFLFVELAPNGAPLARADARLPLPPTGAANPYVGLFNVAIQARALVWADAYLRSHRGSASVFVRTPELLVLRIVQ